MKTIPLFYSDESQHTSTMVTLWSFYTTGTWRLNHLQASGVESSWLGSELIYFNFYLTHEKEPYRIQIVQLLLKTNTFDTEVDRQRSRVFLFVSSVKVGSVVGPGTPGQYNPRRQRLPGMPRLGGALFTVKYCQLTLLSKTHQVY